MSFYNEKMIVLTLPFHLTLVSEVIDSDVYLETFESQQFSKVLKHKNEILTLVWGIYRRTLVSVC